MVTKYCRQCDSIKPIEEFGKRSQNRSGITSQCKACLKKTQDAWRARHPDYYETHCKGHHRSDETKARRRKHDLNAQYGITPEQFDQMLAEQKGRCFLCNDDDPNHKWKAIKRFLVDHDHATGRVRRLLCCRCNSGIGMFRDNPVLIERALLYLRTYADPGDYMI